MYRNISKVPHYFNRQYQRRYYHERVLDHYENPRNVGSLNPKDPNVGTGIVGAPACIHEDTLISLADGRRYESVQNLYLENKIVPVWSYNVVRKIYEIKNARIIKQENKKPMVKVTLDDGSYLICTRDHKFLTRNLKYTECQNVNESPIIPFKRFTTKKGYWELCNNYNHKINKIENMEGLYDCYDLQVEENNNFAIITKTTKNIQSGIILRNCGDVMKLQIQVKDGCIIDSKFKTFGCGSAIASSSLATEWMKGQTIEDVEKLTNKDIAQHLCLPPVKLHCSMLAEDAIKSAIKDYKSKK